ncbi:flagellar hook protein FlgE [Pigmentiphaga soli]|uniref:Flagellar basal-body rod protein FlgF n=1 Tax=Pigmentiphaga soli TaxID=1007095 RepID=A0ABP8GNT9_9BURK
MSFQQALSGLNAASKNLDVIGNNVANANTAGFKGARAEFADVYASTSMGVNTGTVGIGTQVSGVSQSFTQGNVSVTDRPFDIAISGDGFFRMDDNGNIVYTRNGQFQRDANGYLVNANGMRLTGFPADATGNINMSQPGPLQLLVNSIEARATQTATQGAIIDSRSDVIDAADVPFDPDNSQSFTHATSMNVYDSLGNSHMMSTYYVKRDSGDWAVYVSIDGQFANQPTPPSATIEPVTTLAFGNNGKLDTSGSNSNGHVTIGPMDLDNGAAPISFAYDLSQTTQTGQDFSNDVQLQDGYTSGRLTSFSIDDHGIITANYSNQQSRAQGQILLATFNNPEGLASVGNNNFAETTTSGVPRLGGPASSDFGSVRAGALEDANVDLTKELVDMITAQRVYQANAQTIKTQDSLMQTLVNLR